jgi:hypothetical protein
MVEGAGRKFEDFQQEYLPDYPRVQRVISFGNPAEKEQRSGVGDPLPLSFPDKHRKKGQQNQ